MRRISRVTHSADQAIGGDGNFNTLTFDTKVVAIPANSYKPDEPTKLYVKQKGYYGGKVRIMMDAGGGHIRFLGIQKSAGKTVGATSVPPVADGNLHTQECSFENEWCEVGDYFECIISQDSGVDLNVIGGNGQDVFPGFSIWRMDS